MEIAGYKKNPQDESKALSTFAEISCNWKKRTPFRRFPGTIYGN